MNKFSIPFIVYAFSLFSISTLCAQGGLDTLRIQATARGTGDHVRIRWAPVDIQLWRLGILHGYTLERRTMQRNGTLLPTAEQQASVVVLQKVIKPQPPGWWKDKIDTSDLAGIAAGSIYGEQFEINDLVEHDFLRMYNTVQQRDAQFHFGLFAADQSFQLAKHMGLAFVDLEVQANETYLYRVYLTQAVDHSFLQPGITAGSPGTGEPLPTLYQVQAKFGNKQVQLIWNFEDFRAFYASYEVECSDDLGMNFKKVNALPIVATKAPGMDTKNIFYSDSLPENFRPYFYRVRGKSIFDEYGPYSNVVRGKGLPKPLSVQMGITNITETAPKNLLLTWEFPDALNDRLSGFECFRASKKEGPFVKITSDLVPNHQRSFLDTAAHGTNYYVVKALDIYGHKYSTFSVLGQLSDAVPPAPPTGLQAAITKSGEVKLSWTPNQEEDLMGYRVFMANAPEGDYAQLTSIYTRDTFYTFQVRMNVLNKEFYCKVIALDYRENYSDYSSAIAITRPDVIPPIAPLIKKVRPSSDGVLIHWLPSTSEDVELHLLQRKAPYESNWTTLAESQWQNYFYVLLDSTADSRFEYQYRVLAIDHAGLKSSSKVYGAKIIDRGEREPIEALRSEVDRKEKEIILSWEYSNVGKLYQFVLYRSKDEEPLRTYKELTMTSEELAIEFLPNLARFQFRDPQLSMDTQYRYQLLAKHRNGGSSPLSKVIEVRY